MSHIDITPNPENFSDIPVKETTALLHVLINSPENHADAWYPNQADRRTTIEDLRWYLWYALEAHDARLKGLIQDAQHCEREMEEIYQRLPEYARW